MNIINSKDIVTIVPIKSLKTFKDFPFEMHEDESLAELVSSIKNNGVVTPLIVMPLDSGGYEIISGHRRKKAAELAGIKEIPVLVRQYSREDAIISMVDSNIQRESILCSEKAKAYKMKFDALKVKEGRPLSGEERDDNTKTIDEVAKNAPDKARTIQMYMKMLSLIPEIMSMVDSKKIGISTGYELAFLSSDEQKTVLTSIETEGPPTRSQALRLKKLSKEGNFNEDTAFTIMQEQKKPEPFNVVIPMEKFKKYFPKAASPKDIEERLLSLLEKIYQQQIAKKHNQER